MARTFPERRRRRGSTAIEYGLIVALMCLIALGGMVAMSQSLSSLYDQDESELGQALAGN